MSKGKALTYAIITLLIGCIFLPMQIYGCFLPFLIAALIFGAIAYAKHRRDLEIVAEAETKQMTPPAQMVLPPMTTKGSNGRLFIPPPLK